ncbi:hypothetical protein HA052_18445 [Chromobacterium haemolyticum]|uniref:Uncharacterized protein n=1 Tax=Chromobacterium fluminis TaxID=3044269 RepID=A0ABX0LC49_9NEIS|nr:hypothetical protein [Chromobacterium haemolyticum]NHR07176.1 hypothetical protein [Chromobacterium haemolyticum]
MKTWQKASLIGVLLLTLLGLLGYQVQQYPAVRWLVLWILPMSLTYTTDTNGERLRVNTPYYVREWPRTFSTNYFDGEILSMEAAEQRSGLASVAINDDQKIAYRKTKRVKREPYTSPIDYERFGIKVNGIYFFGLDADGQLNRLLTIEQALLEPVYIKANIHVAKVRSAEKVIRTEIGPAYFSYWPDNGPLKTIRGFYVKSNGYKRSWLFTYTQQAKDESDHEIKSQTQTTPFPADIPLKILGIKTDGRYLLGVLPDGSAGFPRPELDALADQRHIELWVADGQVYRATLISFVTTGENWTSYDKDGNYLKRWGYDIENGRKVEWQQKFDRSVGQRGGEWVPPRPQDQDDD